MTANFFYVYTFTSSLDGNVFYVGKGSGTRITDHLYEAHGKKADVSRVAQKIRSIWEQGGKVIAEKPYRDLSEGAALRIETDVIEQYGYENLVNDPWSKHRRLLTGTHLLWEIRE